MTVKVTIESSEPVEVNGVIVPPAGGTGPVDPPANTSHWSGTFKDLTGWQFGNQPKGQRFALPGIERAGVKTVTFHKAGQTVMETRVGEGTSVSLPNAEPVQYTMYVEDEQGNTVSMTFNPSQGGDVPFTFASAGGGYTFQTRYPGY